MPLLRLVMVGALVVGGGMALGLPVLEVAPDLLSSGAKWAIEQLLKLVSG
jgi:hypothetical protein